MTTFTCKICGYEYESETTDMPEGYVCPVCGAPLEDFVPNK